MGVAGLYQRLKKKGLCPPPVHPSSLAGKMFHIDFLGCYFGPLLQQLQKDSSIENGRRIGVRLGTTIAETFGHHCLVHCDGAATKEKEKAHQERQEKRDKAKIKLDKALSKMEARSSAGAWTSRAVITTIEQSLKRMFVTPGATMDHDGCRHRWFGYSGHDLPLHLRGRPLYSQARTGSAGCCAGVGRRESMITF